MVYKYINIAVEMNFSVVCELTTTLVNGYWCSLFVMGSIVIECLVTHYNNEQPVA